MIEIWCQSALFCETWSQTLELLSHSDFSEFGLHICNLELLLVKKHLAPLLTLGVTVCTGGTLQPLNTFIACQNVLPALPVQAIALQHLGATSQLPRQTVIPDGADPLYP